MYIDDMVLGCGTAINHKSAFTLELFCMFYAPDDIYTQDKEFQQILTESYEVTF